MPKEVAQQITQLLHKWKAEGDSAAEAELFLVLEQELLRMARVVLAKNAGFSHKIDPRELLSEAYLSLRSYPVFSNARGPFFALMARAMRRVLLDLAKHDRAAKRPATALRVIDTELLHGTPVDSELGPLEFYQALDALKAIDARQARVLELRVIGLTNDEIASAEGISVATIKRDLAEARAFVAFQLGLPSDWIRP